MSEGRALDPDGLFMPEVGEWAVDKHRLLGAYCGIFARAMRGKWPNRVYIDLFAGAGRSKLKGTSRIVEGSPTVALQVEFPFDHYVFCDENRRCMDALRARVQRDFPSVSATFIEGDCNEDVGEVLAAVPRSRGTLALCLVDPFAIANLKFDTLRKIAEGRRVDFLVLVPTHMDANRNQARLQASDQPRLDEFLGSDSWRSEWTRRTQESKQPSFGTFVLEQFGLSMQRIDYLSSGPGRDVPVTDGSRILYYLAFYSRHPLGAKFWSAAMKAARPQLPLF